MSADAPLPLLTTEISAIGKLFSLTVEPGQPIDADAHAGLLAAFDALARLAALQDRELALHRELMDATHARKIAAALGGHTTPETMQ